MAKENLSTYELNFIKQREEHVGQLIEAIQAVSRFKEGDYLVAFYPANSWAGRRPITNSYGAPKKFMVVHTDKYGVPYMKELNKKGKTFGNLITPIKFENGNRIVQSSEYEFEVDPDYADSIILADEENYDAAMVHRMKGDLFKEITNHNKSIKVKVNDTPTLIKFLQNLKVGDVLWRSIKTNLTITKLDPIPLTHRNTRIDEYKDFGLAVDSKGKEHTLNAHFFKWIAIYTDRPRSYNELKDPK